MVVLEQALAYVCCSVEEGKTKVQRYCRKIYELGYVPICPQYSFSPFLDDGDAEDIQTLCLQNQSHFASSPLNLSFFGIIRFL